jgi:hypothetical protein
MAVKLSALHVGRALRPEIFRYSFMLEAEQTAVPNATYNVLSSREHCCSGLHILVSLSPGIGSVFLTEANVFRLISMAQHGTSFPFILPAGAL